MKAKIAKKSIKNPSKIMKNQGLEALGGSWGLSGSSWEESWLPGAILHDLWPDFGFILGARGSSFGSNSGYLFDHFFVRRLGKLLDRFFFDFSSILALVLPPFFEFF